MFYNKIRQLKNSKFFMMLLLVSLLLITFLYLRSFFATGVDFNGIFLKKTTISNEVRYAGKGAQGDIIITVAGIGSDTEKSKAEVAYNLPGNINRHYVVYFNHKGKYALENVEIRDENENTLFEGTYQRGSLYLYDLNNGPLIENIILYSNADRKITYDKNYEVPLINIVQFASHEKESIRGHLGMLFVALVLISITAVDIKYPLFFFTLRYSMDVESPKPTEFYTTVQKISWYINPAIALILLLLALQI